MVEGRLQAHHRRRPRTRQRGVALVEFALIAPVLFLLLFGIMEFGWLFLQNIDVRHGAREGARLAAVNFKTTASPSASVQQDQIIGELCSRMDDAADVAINLFRPGAATVGEEIEVRVQQDYNQLTGFLDFAVSDVKLTSTVSIRLEQEATWESHPDRVTFEDCP